MGWVEYILWVPNTPNFVKCHGYSSALLITVKVRIWSGQSSEKKSEHKFQFYLVTWIEINGLWSQWRGSVHSIKFFLLFFYSQFDSLFRLPVWLPYCVYNGVLFCLLRDVDASSFANMEGVFVSYYSEHVSSHLEHALRLSCLMLFNNFYGKSVAMDMLSIS